jgi:Ca2+-binding RTX toxin-like protein
MPQFTGTPGDDTLVGTAGADELIGLGGNDIYFVNDVNDVVVEAIGGGFDIIYSTVSYTLGANSEVEILSVTDHSATSALNFTGNGFGNYLYGNAGANVLNGGGGVDVMLGFGGNDIFFVDSAGDYVGENVGGGFDIIYSTVSYALDPNSEVEILSVTDHSLTTAISFTGNQFANYLYGNAGNNVLFGGAGGDVMLGFGGNDTFYVDSAGDYVGENAGGGTDIIYSSVSYALQAGNEIEILSVTDHSLTTAIDFTGNEFANYLYGNAGNNVLNGGAGGGDVMLGFGGNDTFYVDSAGDYVGETVGGGTDTIYSSVSYALDPNSEIEILSVTNHSLTTAIDFSGNQFANNLYGNAGSNILFGGGGADVMLGFGGNDTFYVDNAGDYVGENAGGGFDVIYASVSYVLAAGSEVEILSVDNYNATTAINLTGNEFANNLYGNAGANILNGGAGADLLAGFGGADKYAFTTALGGGNVDTILGFAGAGTDGDDLILLDHAVFTGLGLGALNSDAFFAGAAAHDADDRIIYDPTTGALYFDADGNGAGAAVQFAILADSPSLSAGDFTVI